MLDMFITEFLDKGWTKKSTDGEVEKVWNSRHVNMFRDIALRGANA